MRRLWVPVFGDRRNHFSQDPSSPHRLVLGDLSDGPGQERDFRLLQLSKEIGVSYPTAWLLQHKIRKAMADRDQHYQLSGLIEVDEGYTGGAEQGDAQKGRGAKTKSVVAVAVERLAPGAEGEKPIPGFAALSVIPNAAASSLHGFLQAKVKAGSRVLSDGWKGYLGLEQQGFQHTATPLQGDPEAAHRLFPWVHITLSNLKRFLLGTHHKVEPKHLKRYVAEFSYRLNRRSMETTLFDRLCERALPPRPSFIRS
jgi:transposase-like protein